MLGELCGGTRGIQQLFCFPLDFTQTKICAAEAQQSNSKHEDHALGACVAGVFGGNRAYLQTLAK